MNYQLLYSGSFTAGRIYSFTSWFGCEVNLSSGLKDMEKRASGPCLELNFESLFMQPAA